MKIITIISTLLLCSSIARAQSYDGKYRGKLEMVSYKDHLDRTYPTDDSIPITLDNYRVTVKTSNGKISVRLATGETFNCKKKKNHLQCNKVQKKFDGQYCELDRTLNIGKPINQRSFGAFVLSVYCQFTGWIVTSHHGYMRKG